AAARPPSRGSAPRRATPPVLFEHGYDKESPCSRDVSHCHGGRISFEVTLMLSEVRNVLHLLGRGQAGKRIAGSGTERWLARAFLAPGGRRPVHRRHAVRTVFVQQQRAEFGLTNASGIREHRLEHWLQFPGG